MDPTSTNGTHPPGRSGRRSGGTSPPPPEAAASDQPGCWQVPGLLLKLVFLVALLVAILWLLVVFLTTLL